LRLSWKLLHQLSWEPLLLHHNLFNHLLTLELLHQEFLALFPGGYQPPPLGAFAAAGAFEVAPVAYAAMPQAMPQGLLQGVPEPVPQAVHQTVPQVAPEVRQEIPHPDTVKQEQDAYMVKAMANLNAQKDVEQAKYNEELQQIDADMADQTQKLKDAAAAKNEERRKNLDASFQSYNQRLTEQAAQLRIQYYRQKAQEKFEAAEKQIGEIYQPHLQDLDKLTSAQRLRQENMQRLQKELQDIQEGNLPAVPEGAPAVAAPQVAPQEAQQVPPQETPPAAQPETPPAADGGAQPIAQEPLASDPAGDELN